MILRLPPGKLHLRKLALLERILEGVRTGTEPGAALAEVTRVDAAVLPDPWFQTIAAYALLSCGTALLLGGAAAEVMVSAIVGIVIGILAAVGQRSLRVDRVFEIAAAFLATIIVSAWERAVGPIALYVVVIAGVVQLLPGYSLTTALNELANRNLVSGTARLGGVFVTLLSLACGFALALGVTNNAVLTGPTVGAGGATPVSVLGGAALMGVATASILHARWRDLAWIVGSSVGTVALARFFAMLGITQTTPFATAFAVGLATSLAGRYLRIPQAVVLVPALLVLVPGSLSYQSLLYVFSADSTDAVSLAVHVLLASILIVAGFLTSQLVAPPARTAR